MKLNAADMAKVEAILGRRPTVVEENVFDTMWSEHCSYKSSKPVLRTLPTEGSEVVLGVGEDSGIVHFLTHEGKKYGIALSHESHNHPSQILPIEGAATGVGGVVRDVYCMGADVIGVLDSLHFGLPGQGDMAGEIAEKVVEGVAEYGNALGVPVLGGETIYHRSYNENCLVNVAALGIVVEDQIIRSRVPKEAAHEPYDVILLGKSTDATGFGGASFSSAVLDEADEQQNMGAVQVHDPFLKRVIVEAMKALFAWARDERVVIGMKDLGAGGIACAGSELAVAGGFGVRLNLDDVNVAYEGLGAEVIACSETQERFCLAVPRRYSEAVLRLFNEEFDLPKLYPKAGAVVVGEVISEPVFQLLHQGEMVCDLPVSAITTEVLAERKAEAREIVREGVDSLGDVDVAGVCKKMLASLNQCSKRYVYRYYDNAVRGDTVLYPGEGDAVVVTPVLGSDAAMAVSMDSNVYGIADPYVSGAAAVAEAVRNVVAVGARPIAVTDCLNYGNPEQGSVFFDFEEGVRGIGDAARALGFIPGEDLPIISGNVSFYNESTTGSAVVPSPVVCAVGRMDDYRSARRMRVPEMGLRLLMLGRRYAEFAGTAVADLLGDEGFQVAPQVRLAEEAAQNKLVYELIQTGQVVAAHDISAGGMWQCVTEMLMGERGQYSAGAVLDFSWDSDIAVSLFSENGGYVLALDEAAADAALAAAAKAGVWAREIGRTVEASEIRIERGGQVLHSFLLDELRQEWNAQNAAHPGTAV